MTPTHTLNGRRRAFRTAFQTFVGLCLLAPVLVAETGLDVAQLPWLVPVLAVAAAVCRIMALPQVDDFLTAHLPWLAMTPNQAPTPEPDDGEDATP